MNLSEETSENLKQQNGSLSENFSIQNDKQILNAQTATSILNERSESVKNFLDEKLFGLGNPYIEYPLWPNDSRLESTRDSVNLGKVSYSPCKVEDGKHAIPTRIIKSQSDFLQTNLLNGIENQVITPCKKIANSVDKILNDIIPLKPSEEKMASKKRHYENGETESIPLKPAEEKIALKKRSHEDGVAEFIPLKPAEERIVLKKRRYEDGEVQSIAFKPAEEKLALKKHSQDDGEVQSIPLKRAEEKLVLKKHSQDDGEVESVPLKPAEEKIASKKRSHEDGEDNGSVLEESVDTKKEIPFKTEKEMFFENPLMQFILKAECSNTGVSVTEYFEEFYTNHLAPVRERTTEDIRKKENNNGVDIFGNHLTLKNRNKIKVICPRCSRKVSTPGFTRHLAYCMNAKSLRKSRRRS